MMYYSNLTKDIERLEKQEVSSEKIIEIYEDINYEKSLTFGNSKLLEILHSLEYRFYEAVDNLPDELSKEFCKYYWRS